MCEFSQLFVDIFPQRRDKNAKQTFEPQVHDLGRRQINFLELIFAQSRQHVASVLLEEGRLIGTGGMKNQMIKA